MRSRSTRALLPALALAFVCAEASFAQGFGGARIADLTPTNLSSPMPYPPNGNPAVPVWTHRVSMPMASYLRLHARMDLGMGDSLVVRDSQGAEKWRYTGKGPVSQRSAGSADENALLPIPGLGEEFHTDTVFDDTITLELYAQSGGLGVQIHTIEHGFPWAILRTITSPETPCTLTPPFLDFECETQPARVANGNAVCGLASTAVFCSGTLISNQSHVLTANHCVSTQSGANTLNFWFRFQELCGTGTLRGTVVVPAPQTFVLGQPHSPGPDYTVLRANGTPHMQFGFARLEARDPGTNESLYIIGHPSGRPKEITYGPARGVIGFTGNTHFQHRADTEGGNSGSGVFSDVSHCIVGVHTNGGCTTGDPNSGNWASRMSQDFAAIQTAVPGVAVCGASSTPARCDMNEVLPQSATNATSNSSTGFPWGGTTARRTLYAYGRGVLGFDKPVRFNAVEFRPNEGGTTSSAASYDFALFVSTGRRGARNLDYTFDNNHGADKVKVFDGVLNVPAATLGASPNPFILKVPFSVPFEWDPAAGPLLLDIQYRSGVIATGGWDGAFGTNEDIGRISLSSSSNGAVANFPGGAGNPTQNFALAARLCLDCETVPDAYSTTEANSNSAFPWNSASPMRVLYSYDGSVLGVTGRQRITRLGWRPENGNAFGGATYDVRISLSTGVNPSNALSTNFAANHGADRVVVFDGVWTSPAAPASAAPQGFVHSIELQNAFEYNPALGPLVVDLQLRATTNTAATAFDGAFNTGEPIGRISNTVDPNATTSNGAAQNFAYVLGVCGEPCPTLPPAGDNAMLPGTGTGLPFNSTSSSRWQYMYGPTTLGTTQPIYIQHLRFRPDEAATSIGPASFTCTIDLSTAATTPATMSSTFDTNHGANRARVFDGTFSVPFTTGLGDPRLFPVSVQLDTPFYYDPAAGPLLLDIRMLGLSGSSANFDTTFTVTPAPDDRRMGHSSDPNAAVANFSPQRNGLALSLCGVGCNALAVSYGTGCAGTNGTPINTTRGLPTIPNPNFGYRMVSGPASQTAALWMGISSLNLDLSGAGATGCFLLNTLDIASFSSATNASGEALIASPVPSDPLLDGLTVFVQWVAIDPGAPRSLPVVLSNGLRITLCF
ncbi:MAG: trypsin-like peptidase domain-containing protein [Planctomycetes bacterium]|nr:trypsin-like peptidase domain-containing protein [Planctomycetota bacterium]